MTFIIRALGYLQIAFGLFALVAGKSAMTETTAAAAFGLGTVALGLGEVLQRMDAKPTPLAPTQAKDALIEIYRMQDIRRGANGFSAMGNTFADLDAAKAFIDRRDNANR